MGDNLFFRALDTVAGGVYRATHKNPPKAEAKPPQAPIRQAQVPDSGGTLAVGRRMGIYRDETGGFRGDTFTSSSDAHHGNHIVPNPLKPR